MNTSAKTEQRSVADQSFEVVSLQAGGAIAELWPALGGNCVRWATADAGEVLYSPPIEELIARPTRGGIPVLFPFPNRIRAGKFSWNGKDYQLPLNDSTNENAIHGFTPRHAWRLQDCTSIESSAQATLVFRTSIDAPRCVPLWPSDLEITVGWILSATSLSCQVSVHNPAATAAPWGLGFHPYFKTRGVNDLLHIAASSRWELAKSIPTGTVLPLDRAFDFQMPRPIADVRLDDVFTQLTQPLDSRGLRCCGQLRRTDGVNVSLYATAEFRELVVFTPPHGQAVCLEPYTCPTDAANLTAKSLDVGWKALGAGETCTGRVEYEIGRG